MNSKEKAENLLINIFEGFIKTICNNIPIVVMAIMKTISSNTSQISQAMSELNGKTLNTNNIRLRRLLHNQRFEINEIMWRPVVNLVFSLLKERKFIKKGQLISINVDYTTIRDKFLLLTASIPFMNRGIPLYFSIRCYPKRKGKIDMISMEKSFLRGLRRLLSLKYRYVIVADRGFGNQRFAQDAINEGFDYILRTKNNKNVDFPDSKRVLLKNFKEGNFDYPEISLNKGAFKTRLITCFQNSGKGWYILTSLKKDSFESIQTAYKRRWGIEMMFFDLKSGGFDLEKSKIQDYSSMKRMIFLVMIAKILVIFTSDWINEKEHHIIKKYPMHTGLISAFSNLESDFACITGT